MTSEQADTIYWSRVACGDWTFIAAATRRGLCFVGSNGASADELASWAAARRPKSGIVRDDRFMEPYVAALSEYLGGSRSCGSDLPCDLNGTPFQLAVWEALKRIPHGCTQTYSDIANAIGRSTAVRAVGAAIGANPVLIAVPCHRVIGKNGGLTGYRGGMAMKKALLELERGGASVRPRGAHGSFAGTTGTAREFASSGQAAERHTTGLPGQAAVRHTPGLPGQAAERRTADLSAQQAGRTRAAGGAPLPQEDGST